MPKFQFSFDINLAMQLREAMNEKVDLSIKKQSIDHNTSYPSWARMCAAMDRIEDTLTYINDTPIGDRHLKIAFDFYEFVNNAYTVIESIRIMAEIFSVSNERIVSIKRTNQIFKKNGVSDDDYFRYFRSLITHSVDTTYHHHKSIMTDSLLDCCPRIFWTKEVFGYSDQGDLAIPIYKIGKDDYHDYEYVNVEMFERYLQEWVDLIPDIIQAINKYNDDQFEIFRATPVKSLEGFSNDVIAYLDYLKNEEAIRCNNDREDIFEWYKIVFRISLINKQNEALLEKYKQAIIYSLQFVRNRLQNMVFTGFDNTGIINEPDGEMDLFNELYSPSFFSKNAFDGYHYNLGKLYYLEGYGDYGDRLYARYLLDEIKQTINRYVCFTNEESDEEAVVLTRIALFFSALDSDCILNRSIPNESKYRIALLSDEMYKELMTSKKEDTEGISIREILKNFID